MAYPPLTAATAKPSSQFSARDFGTAMAFMAASPGGPRQGRSSAPRCPAAQRFAVTRVTPRQFARRPCLSPLQIPPKRVARKRRFRQADQGVLGDPVLPAKIIRFAVTPNHPYNSGHPVPLRGAYRDRHGRWVRDAMDAAASGARGVAGRISVSDRPPRRRPALKRLGRNLDRQHMSRSKRFGGGSRGRQRRVVLAPVAGVKLMEICRAQPGFGGSSIRQRWRQEEFVSRESAL